MTSKYADPQDWTFYRSVVDGERLELEGLNIWDHQWHDLHQYVRIKDPIYGQDHVMGIFEITNGGITVTFAAGEFSNLVWGICLPASKMS